MLCSYIKSSYLLHKEWTHNEMHWMETHKSSNSYLHTYVFNNPFPSCRFYQLFFFISFDPQQLLCHMHYLWALNHFFLGHRPLIINMTLRNTFRHSWVEKLIFFEINLVTNLKERKTSPSRLCTTSLYKVMNKAKLLALHQKVIFFLKFAD